MKTLRLVGATVWLAAVASTASAYTVKGHLECPDVITEDANENFRSMNMWWLLGYVTARNYSAGSNIGENIEDERLYEIALDYCRGHPDNDWDDAAIHLYDLLK